MRVIGQPLKVWSGILVPIQNGLGKYPLTEIAATLNLENVPDNNARHNVKQTFGGNVTITQPPAMSGFFMSATFPRDCTILPGIASLHTTPLCGKTRSVSERTLYGSRQLFKCQNVKQTFEVNAMRNATAHSTATPVATAKDSTCPTLIQSNECCLFHSSTLLEALRRAKAKQRKDERGVAYYELLQAFHRSVLPTFILETGSISKASELLGIHRGTLSRYIGHADIDLEQYVGGGA